MQLHPGYIKTGKIWQWLATLILLTGTAVRVGIYLQNRNLMLDEANLARNIAERGFAELLLPLSYEQYAPPVFLWILKLESLLFGMGELPLRLYTIFCGVVAVVLFYKIVAQLLPRPAMWFSAVLFAFCPIFLRYSSELKQYMPDVCIALLLIWLALIVDIKENKQKRYVLIWAAAGSIAVWASMPSVFILAGVGVYYGWKCIESRKYKFLLPVIIVSCIWLIQFSIYYYWILAPQANSDYLQNFHHYDFLFATPSKREEWQHNWYTFSALMRQFEGLYPYVHDINTAFLIAGAITLARKATALFFLLVVPVLALCFAAAMDQFSLMPRVSLFIVPVLMLIIGYGFSQYFYLRSVVLKAIIILAGVYSAGCNIYQLSEKTFRYEELTEGMSFLQANHVPAVAVSVYHSSVPAFIYYTTLHPKKDTWASLKDADRLDWSVDYDSLSWQMRYVWSSRRPLGFLFTNCTDAEFKKRKKGLSHHMQLADSLDKPYIKSYIYIKPLGTADAD